MIISREKCNVCGEGNEFDMADDETLYREAKCVNCGASIRNSDVASSVLNFINMDVDSLKELSGKNLEKILILNTCSTGAIHDALKNLRGYVCSEYFEDVPVGEYNEGILSVDLSQMPFPDNSLDLIISEDVFEHVENYEIAMSEIFRVLKPGGEHIFTVPIHDGKKTVSRKGKKDVFHGDPKPGSGEGGVLVYTDWGEDVSEIVSRFGFEAELIKNHTFFSKSEVTDIDSDYDEYLKHASDLQRYFKYNSYVVRCRKPESEAKCAEMSEAWYHELALNKRILKKNEEIRRLNDDNKVRGEHIKDLDKELANDRLYIDRLQADVEHEKSNNSLLLEKNEKQTKRIIELQNEEEERNKCIKSQSEMITDKERLIEEQARRIEEKEKEIERQSFRIADEERLIEEQSKRIADEERLIEEKSKRIKEKDKQIEEQLEKITNNENKIEEQSNTIIKLQDVDHEKNKHINDLTGQNDSLIVEIAELKQTVRNKEGHIELLLEVEREYEREKKSRAYRFAKKVGRIPEFFFPQGSKRRFFAKVVKRCLRHPSFILKALNPGRISRFFKALKEGGMDEVNHHYDLIIKDIESGKVDNSGLDVTVTADNGESKAVEEYEKIEFAKIKTPEVSIVIPVYNQFDYTYNCLASIKKHSGEVTYEIIIADDCSTDLTQKISDIVSGIKVVRNKTNLRFLLNCNNAAKQAKGKYILFLNNDTQVQENWLKPLVDMMKDDKVGMTGSKLVYSDGRLQEAGGILWNDGSAWNYGNKMNPEDPEYNYVKEADYISGAAIMIRKSLWKEIGGFDERFVPAYYEDTDLAFEVRKHGYKVMYQPLSVVVHFEGVSNGTDTSSGQKAYQVANAKKFFEKWKDVLEKEHFNNAENVFIAKDRSRFKKHILVVDQYVPWHDQDAGCKCSYMYLLMFLKMGFQVTFIGDNYYKHEPYTTELNQLGIEVLYGNYYYNNWQQFLKDNLKYFDYVYLQRPHISIKYIDLVKQYSHAKVFYFAHDLHHVREKREYEITGNAEKLESSKKWKEIEYELFSKADVGHVVGSYEQGIMQKVFPDKPIRNIPLYIYDDVPDGILKDFSKRKDMMYVGGFGHAPNIDAVMWFGKEVMPLIVAKYPDIKWHIVGSKATDEVKALASDNIIVDGFLSDEDLAQMYKSCRIDIVPLRFGAGVKGKVVESAYFQIPLVTTSIGAEGLDDKVGNMHVVDDAKEMAEYICSIYEDYDRLKEMSDAGSVFIEKYFTSKCAEDILRLDIKDL